MPSPEGVDGITSVSELFTYHIFGTPRDLERWQEDVDIYRFSIGGLVERAANLSMKDVRENYEPVSADMVLQCMTNIHWGRIHFHRRTAAGRYGYKWCKWLSEINVVNQDYKGHYEGKRRWSDAGARGTKVRL